MTSFFGGIFNWGGAAAAPPPANPLGDKPPGVPAPGAQGGIGGGGNDIQPAPHPDPLADPHAAELAAKAALKKDDEVDPLGAPHQPPGPQFPPPADPVNEEAWYVSAWNSFTTFWCSLWDSACTTVTSWYESLCDCFKGSS